MASVKTTITEQGLALIDSIINGSGELAFTGIEIGDGENINSSALVTELVNKRMDVVISKVYASDDGTTVCGNVDNSTVTESFEIREIGVFAKQEGSEDAPILFAYTECEGVGGIPAASIVAINNEMLITLATGNANVLYIDNPAATLTRQDIVELKQHIEENYFTKGDIRSGVQTQSIFGYDPLTGEDTKNTMYLTGDTITVMIDGREIAFPVEAGTLALKSDLDGKADEEHTHDVGDINATLAQYEDANNSTRGSNERHGKVIFITSDDNDNGGIYIGGSESTRISWMQRLSRFQWDKIRAYGNTNRVYEDYVLTPKEDGSNADKQIARMQDLAGKQDKLTAGENITIAEDGTISASGGGSVTVDAEIAEGGTNPVTGGAIHTALEDKAALSVVYNDTIPAAATATAEIRQGNMRLKVMHDVAANTYVDLIFNDETGGAISQTLLPTFSYLSAKVDPLAERVTALEESPSASAHGINPDGAVSHTATQTYDETSGYTYTKDVTATENGYLSCQATQTHESDAANKIILTCSINGTVIHKDCANGYGDMASILIPVAKGQTVNVQATSSEPATVEVKFMPLLQ